MADPQRIGRYLIKRPLGRGGMGTVYLAEDPMLKRWVAIKVVTTFDEAREHAMARFRREAEISAQLNHPNVVTVFDVGMEPDVGPFLAMEYVEGESLGQKIELGGDRGARAGVARAAEQIAWAALSAEEREVLSQTADRFLESWTLQERVTQLAAAERLAEASSAL